MSSEFELKLRLGPKQFERMARLLGTEAGSEPRTKRLKSVYFDTPDHSLAARRVALRVRHDGNRRIQTIKTEQGESQGYARGEWERELAGDEPDLSNLKVADKDAALLLSGAAVRDQLVAVFETDFERSEWRLDLDGGTKVLCALDLGEVRSGDKSRGIREAELELKTGRPADVFELARRLHRGARFRLESRSKAAIGYGLRSFWPAPPRFAPPDLDPGDTVEQAARRVASACVTHLRLHQGRFLERENALAIHQMRVASRRLRSFLQLLKDGAPAQLADIRTELKWFAKRLARARDWDVFLAETLAPVRAHLADESSLDLLADLGGQAREAAYGRAHTALESRRFTGMLLDMGYRIALEDWSEHDGPGAMQTPVRERARSLLNGLWLAARDVGHDLTVLDRAALHALRIRIKKLRYGCEFFASLYPDQNSSALIDRLRKLQDIFGHIQDVTATATLLQSLAPSKKQVDAVDRAAGIVAGWQVAAERKSRTKMVQAWAEFEKQAPFWG